MSRERVEFGAILFLAVGLAMDAAAVSIARGVAAKRLRARDVLSVAVCFGGFQALMPAIGWMLGASLGAVVSAFAHWMAFGLLVAIGAKMLLEARQAVRASSESDEGPLQWRILVVLGVATSVDALAVGFTLPMLEAPLGLSLSTIGVTAALFSGAGFAFGRRLGAASGKRLEVVGGLVLIGLGIEILFDGVAP